MRKCLRRKKKRSTSLRFCKVPCHSSKFFSVLSPRCATISLCVPVLRRKFSAERKNFKATFSDAQTECIFAVSCVLIEGSDAKAAAPNSRQQIEILYATKPFQLSTFLMKRCSPLDFWAPRRIRLNFDVGGTD